MSFCRIGVISDTHLDQYNDELIILNDYFFNDADMILHCGDLTKASVLYPFSDKNIKAVSGNMDSIDVRSLYPFKEELKIFSLKLLLIHGAGYGTSFYNQIKKDYPEIDIFIYGHTHNPEISIIGNSVYFNPGSFSHNRSSLCKRSCGMIEIASDGHLRFMLINIEKIADKKFKIIEEVKWEKQ